MPMMYEIESQQRVMELLKELGAARGEKAKLVIAADLLGEAGVIADVPVAKKNWRDQ